MAYHDLGLLTSVTDVQSKATSYEYGARGNRTAVVDALANRTEFTYDDANQLTGITYLAGTTAATTVHFVYDARGRRTSSTDQNRKTTSYAYDDADRLTSVTDAAGNVTHYGYDTEGNLTGITDANSHTTSSACDAFGRVTGTTFPPATDDQSALTESYVYDAIGNLTSRTDRKGRTIAYTYDDLNRLTHKVYPGSTGVDYVYDVAGKLQSVTDPTGSYGFTYDNMGWLTGTSTQYAFLTGLTFTNSYGYDAASNWTASSATGGGANSYTYDTLNRLTTLTNSWAGAFSFEYDDLGRRVQKASAAGTVNYVHDGANIVAEYDVDGQLQASYDQGPGIAEPLAIAHGEQTAYYHADGLGSVTSLTSSAGTGVASYTYDTFGNLINSGGDFVNPFRYTGREWDGETGLYFDGARYYATSSGRVFSEDPLRFGGGINFFAYVGNSPTVDKDPSGHGSSLPALPPLPGPPPIYDPSGGGLTRTRTTAIAQHDNCLD